MTMGYSIDADFREMVGIFFDGQMRDSGKKELCLKTFVRPVRLRLLFRIFVGSESNMHDRARRYIGKCRSGYLLWGERQQYTIVAHVVSLVAYLGSRAGGKGYRRRSGDGDL